MTRFGYANRVLTRFENERHSLVNAPIHSTNLSLRGVWRSTRVWVKGKGADDWLETVAVILLTTASLITAWNGYQAARWGGEQAKAFSKASSARVRASDALTTAQLEMMIDIQVFNDYAAAYTQNNQQMMDFLEHQFSDRLRPAVDAWVALDPLKNPNAPPNPLAMPEYIPTSLDRAHHLEAQADEIFVRGLMASAQSDSYVLNTVYLATALFFAGISAKISGRPARALVISIGAAMLLYGGYHIFMYPTI
jgi:hypothetical protein